MRVKQSGPAPWWFEGGTEVCSACGHSYAYQTGGYCLDCDGTVCSVCVQHTVSMELVCPGCHTARVETPTETSEEEAT